MQGRRVPNRQQGKQGKEHGEQKPNAKPLHNRAIRGLNLEFNRQDLREHPGQKILNAHAEQRATTRADQAHNPGLNAVNAHDLPGLRAHATQNRDRADFLPRVHVNRAGNADTAEQQRGKRDQTQKNVQIAQRAVQAFSPTDNGLGPQIVFLAIGAQLVAKPGELRLVIEFEIGRVRRQTAKLDEARFVEMRQGNVHARRDCGKGHGLPRDFFDAPADDKGVVANAYRIPDLHAKLDEQAIVEQCRRIPLECSRRS